MGRVVLTPSKCCWTKEEELNHCWWFWLLHKLSMRIIRLMWARPIMNSAQCQRLFEGWIGVRWLSTSGNSTISLHDRAAPFFLEGPYRHCHRQAQTFILLSSFQGRGLKFQRFLMGIDITRSCETMINLEDNWIGVWPRNTVISTRLTFYGQWREFPHYQSQLSITANEFVSALLFIGTSRRETELISNVEIFYAFGTVMKGLCHFAGKITISTCVSISSTWCRPPQNKKDSHKIVSWASKQLEEIWISVNSFHIHSWVAFFYWWCDQGDHGDDVIEQSQWTIEVCSSFVNLTISGELPTIAKG